MSDDLVTTWLTAVADLATAIVSWCGAVVAVFVRWDDPGLSFGVGDHIAMDTWHCRRCVGNQLLVFREWWTRFLARTAPPGTPASFPQIFPYVGFAGSIVWAVIMYKGWFGTL